MNSRKRFNKLKDKERLLRLQEIKQERLLNPNEKEDFSITISFTKKEILKIQQKTRILKATHGISRSKVLRKVLLNLDDEDLICFLNLLTRNELKR